jgi:(2R)-sulfolactate sulfo-lyase subunit alpha
VAHQFLVHEKGDTVGVAVEDISPGASVQGLYMNDGTMLTLPAQDYIPLGHKIALCDIAPGDAVKKYGVTIGEAWQAIKAGAHVHVHNLRSVRWKASVLAEGATPASAK